MPDSIARSVKISPGVEGANRWLAPVQLSAPVIPSFMKWRLSMQFILRFAQIIRKRESLTRPAKHIEKQACSVATRAPPGSHDSQIHVAEKRDRGLSPQEEVRPLTRGVGV